MKRLIASLFATSIFALAACEEQGPMEEAGEDMDEATDDAGDAMDDASDGDDPTR